MGAEDQSIQSTMFAKEQSDQGLQGLFKSSLIIVKCRGIRV